MMLEQNEDCYLQYEVDRNELYSTISLSFLSLLLLISHYLYSFSMLYKIMINRSMRINTLSLTLSTDKCPHEGIAASRSDFLHIYDAG